MAAPTVAWDSVTPADLVLRALDIPMLIAQAIPVAPTSARWTEVGGAADVDRTLSTAPALWAYDGKPHYLTTPDATASNVWYYVLDLAAAGVTFDCAFIIGHNFDTLSLVTIELQVADSADFLTNPRTVGSFTLRGNDLRLGDIALTHGAEDPVLRYKDVQYARLKLERVANFTPELGELILGRSRQLENSLLLPVDDRPLIHDVSLTGSDDGVYSAEVHTLRMFELLGTLVLSESAGVADIRAWYRQVRADFAWLWQPASESEDFNLMMLRSACRMQHTGHTSRFLLIDAIEQGPSRFYLDNVVN